MFRCSYLRLHAAPEIQVQKSIRAYLIFPLCKGRMQLVFAMRLTAPHANGNSGNETQRTGDYGVISPNHQIMDAPACQWIWICWMAARGGDR